MQCDVRAIQFGTTRCALSNFNAPFDVKCSVVCCNACCSMQCPLFDAIAVQLSARMQTVRCGAMTCVSRKHSVCGDAHRPFRFVVCISSAVFEAPAINVIHVLLNFDVIRYDVMRAVRFNVLFDVMRCSKRNAHVQRYSIRCAGHSI